MCGLFGFSDRTPTTLALAPALSIYMAQRGTDSWGVTDGTNTYKEPSSILESWADLGLEGPQAYHTRAASVGAVTERNAHPFEHVCPKTGKRVVGVHNGHISNHSDLSKKYPERQFQVDSEHIFAHLAEGKDLGEIGGWGTVVWWEQLPGRTPEGPFFSGWNNVNLAVAKLTSGEIVWASTPAPITIGIRHTPAEIEKFYEIKPKFKYRLTRSAQRGPILITEGELAWAKNPFTTAPIVPVYQGGSAGNSARRSNGSGGFHCGNGACRNGFTHGKALFCKACINEVRTQLGLRSHVYAEKGVVLA